MQNYRTAEGTDGQMTYCPQNNDHIIELTHEKSRPRFWLIFSPVFETKGMDGNQRTVPKHLGTSSNCESHSMIKKPRKIIRNNFISKKDCCISTDPESYFTNCTPLLFIMLSVCILFSLISEMFIPILPKMYIWSNKKRFKAYLSLEMFKGMKTFAKLTHWIWHSAKGK